MAFLLPSLLSLPFAFVLCLALMLGSCPSLVASAEASPVLHDVQDVLAHYTGQLDGKLYFSSPQGQSWEFITDISDSEITNKGDGSFHPFSSDLVEKALAQVSYSLDEIPFDVFILPYPRRGVVESSASSGAMFLSPGVLNCSAELVHFTVTHEMGHIVHRHFMPDESGELWQEYRDLRRINDASVYNADAIHKNRPHEIFAEDFRFLFGSALANYSGTIENGNLPLPTEVAGLRDFMLSLVGGNVGTGGGVASLALNSFPNPFNPVLNVSFSVGLPSTELPQSLAGVATSSAGSSASPQRLILRIYDVGGRLVRTLLDEGLSPGSYSAFWAGTDEQGNSVSSGVYFLRLEAGQQAVTKKVILSR
ncbi:MAG: T9SS type A sorting domain-containing protein [Candidatus Eisenbacteria bacterium]|nr:T9SS type A sorting domain-containing protein [Candidatus Eisenbacteria bacterium]